MKINEIIGKKVIDKNVMEMGKVAEISFDKKTFKIAGLYASTGNAISKKYIQLQPSKILAIGDFVQVSELQKDLLEHTVDKIPAYDSIAKANEIIGKKVLDINANDTGKVSDLSIDIDNQIITELSVSKSVSSFGKNVAVTISLDDINAFGDYLLLNKELNFETNEEPKEEKEDEKVEVKVE